MKLPTTIAIVLIVMTAAGRLALAEVVVPVDSVDTHVNVRLAPDAASEIVGHLERGSRLRHIRTVDGWHEVALEGGGSGFISTDWARIKGDDENGNSTSLGMSFSRWRMSIILRRSSKFMGWVRAVWRGAATRTG
jgi:hypothetical protein